MYDIEEASLPTPPLPGEVVVAADPDEVIERLATDLLQHAENCVRTFGDFHLALSGGAWPGQLYRRLMLAPEFRWIPWRRTHLWFTAEHPVPLDHAESSFRVVNDFIGDHADIPPEQFHPIFASSPTAAEDYEARLREHLGWREKGQDRLDFVLLTVDPAGGTAGMRLGVPRPDGEGRLMARLGSEPGEAPPPPRSPGDVDAEAGDEPPRPVTGPVTMLPGLLNAARFVAVLAVGPEPADALVHAVDLDRLRTVGVPSPDADERDHAAFEAFTAALEARVVGSTEAPPIRSIRPHSGELTWYVDPAACSMILPGG